MVSPRKKKIIHFIYVFNLQRAVFSIKKHWKQRLYFLIVLQWNIWTQSGNAVGLIVTSSFTPVREMKATQLLVTVLMAHSRHRRCQQGRWFYQGWFLELRGMKRLWASEEKKKISTAITDAAAHTHTQYTGRFTKGNPLREMPDFGHSDHFFIYGSPLFYLQDFAPVYESHVIRFQWITEQTGVDTQSLMYGRKHHCDYYYSAWDKAARGGEKEGARGHISPPR